MEVQISKIHIAERIRKENGDIEGLAKSIKDHGLMNPITLMESNDQYVLIAGFRRLSAAKLLSQTTIRATILSPMDAEEQLRLEIEENETRKEFTVAEKLQYADKLDAIEREKARKRMGEHNKADYSAARDRGPGLERRARDAIAKQVGFKSGRQLARASYVADHCPDLIDKIDAGEKTITGAYEEVRGIDRKARKQQALQAKQALTSIGRIDGRVGHIGETFTRSNGFDYVIDEINSASAYFLREIHMAVEHYTDDLHIPANNQTIKTLLNDTLHAAAEAFGIDLKEV